MQQEGQGGLPRARQQASPRVVKTSAAGRELVEVDGFTFIRKRALDPPPPAPSPKRASPAQQPQQQQQQHSADGSTGQPPQPSIGQLLQRPSGQLQLDFGAAGFQPTPARLSSSAQQQPGQLQQPAAQQPDQQPAGQQPPAPTSPAATAPTDGGSSTPVPHQATAITPSRISDLPQCDINDQEIPLQDQLLDCLPASCPAATKIQVMVTQLLQQQPGRRSRPSSEEEAVVEAAARKVGACFCNLLGSAVASARQLLLQPTSGASSTSQQQQQLAGYRQLAPMVRAAAEGPGLRDALVARLAELKREEEVWSKLVSEHAGTVSEPAVVGSGVAEGAAAAGEAAGAQQAPVQAGAGAVAGDGVAAGTGAAAAATAASSQEGGELAGGSQGKNDTAMVVMDALGEEGASAAAAAATAGGEAGTVAGGKEAAGEGAEEAAWAAGLMRHDVENDGPCGVLMAAEEQAVSAVEATVLHVEGVISKAKLVVRSSQQAAAELQALYHADKFDGLPLETPRALIRGIATAPAARLGNVLQMATPI